MDTRHTQPPWRGQLEALLAALEHGLVERRLAVRLMVLVALAGEHTLLIGPPGTAKSELARRLHLAFADGRYFERLLTRFSVPEELFGPLSISALEQDRYERQTAGFLPEASVAFIDEVFKANSAILNALLTLLNEREFDNGAGRQRCPLISAIGATNTVPEDEVAEAFFDRFLLRLPIAPVGTGGFRALLELDGSPPPASPPLDAGTLAALTAAARQVALTDAVAGVLGELRHWLGEQGLYVSDRRWVKTLSLLKVAAASEGRTALSLWDLWLLPWCAAPDEARQAAVGDWLVARLGVREAISPARLTRVVEAFEAQAQVEVEANDLDYDESGRLKFTEDLAAAASDAKGASQAMRMSYTRKRRYGSHHIGARLAQIDALLERLADYGQELAHHQAELSRYAAANLWLDPAFAERARANLQATGAALAALRARALDARGRFEALPRLDGAPGETPAPVAHEPLL